MTTTRRTLVGARQASTRRLQAAMLAIALLLSVVSVQRPAPAQAAQYASVVMDAATGEILESVNADVQTYPASLAKMMTLYLTFDALDAGRLTLNRKLPVSAHAAAQRPSKLGLRAGSTIRVIDAIRALTTKSANDAAVVLAEALGGTERAFARMMTDKAVALGMQDTVFRNASGLPDDAQVTTALDMAILSRAVIYDHAKHYHYFSTDRFKHGGKVYESHNRLLRFYPGADGIKTGYIRASGFNLAASAERDGRRLIAVVMGGENAGSRDRHTADLLDRGFNWAVAGGPPPATPAAARAVPVASVAAPARSSPAALGQVTTATAAADEATGDTGSDVIAEVIRQADVPLAEGGWAIQVGVFSDRSNAQRIAAAAAGLLPQLPAAARPGVFTVQSGDGRTLYRARVVGVTRDAALEACALLERQRQDCLPVES